MDFLPYQANNQEEFVFYSFKYCRVKGDGEDIICWLYKLGRDYNVLFMDFNEFKKV